ncbi:hypothetical protein [Streptomyces sp. NPDC059909]|uniref:hypothetical protein n=1 Tax=Streptomyces sp. NPDC059909 TaxID=3346998 RepID=UPI003663373A
MGGGDSRTGSPSWPAPGHIGGKPGLRTDVVAPGVILTGALASTTKEFREQIPALVRSWRLERAEDIAAMLAFLFSGGGSYVNEQSPLLNGGRSTSPETKAGEGTTDGPGPSLMSRFSHIPTTVRPPLRSSEEPTLGKEVMATSITDIQADHFWSANFLPGPGTGRHRGPRAEDDRCTPGIETSAGHGRHRRTAPGPLIQPAQVLHGHSHEPAQPQTRDEGAGSGWQHHISLGLAAVETFPRHEEAPNAWAARGQQLTEPIAEETISDDFMVVGQARAA